MIRSLIANTRKLSKGYHTSTVRYLAPKDIEILNGYVGEILMVAGQKVKVNDVVMVIESGKAPIKEISGYNGIIRKILVDVDVTISDKTPIFSIDYTSEDNKKK
jgi:pyruvate dehydrogenase E2 component (dihydrolipoamide acetyltransferase)